MHFELKIMESSSVKIVKIVDDCEKASEWLDGVHLSESLTRASIVRVYSTGEKEEYRARRYVP